MARHHETLDEAPGPAHGTPAAAWARTAACLLVAALFLTCAAARAAEAAGVSPFAPAADPSKCCELVAFPVVGEVDATKVSLPLITVGIALLDGFNPCAFFVLFSLLSLVVHARSRRRMLVIGGTFVAFSGAFYFLFMAAWLNVFLLVGGLSVVTTVAGLVAVSVAAINIKDFFYFGKGVSLSIPDGVKPRLFERMRGLMRSDSTWTMLAATVPLAAAANSYELLCTAGFPLVFTRVLTLHHLPPAAYYAYLALYNSVYVLPLAAMVVVFAVTLGSRKLTEWQGRALKLVSGAMMLCLGVVLLFRPDALTDLSISAGILVAALAGAGGVIYLYRRHMPGGSVRT